MQLPDIPSDTSLADELVRLLAAHGPLTYEQVSESFGEDPDDAEWEDRLYGSAVDEMERIVELSDDRLADAVTLLAGWTLTRRITEEEATGGYLELGGDLQPFVTVIDGSVPLRRHGRASVQLGENPGRATTEHLVGPAGWLGDAAAGDLVGLHLADGLLLVTVRPDSGDGGPAADAFAAAARARIDDSEHSRASLVGVVWDAAAGAPQAFAGVLPPLSDIAAAAGLQLTETMVLPTDADIDSLPAATDAIRNAIATVYLDTDADMLAALAHLRMVERRLAVDDAVPTPTSTGPRRRWRTPACTTLICARPPTGMAGHGWAPPSRHGPSAPPVRVGTQVQALLRRRRVRQAAGGAHRPPRWHAATARRDDPRPAAARRR